MAAATRRTSGPVLRSLSPSGRFYSPRKPSSSSSAFASSSATAFSARSSSSAVVHGSSSPTRVNLYNPAPSVRFSLDRCSSPSRSVAVVNKNHHVVQKPQKRTCMCSPTNHPGSFRCSLHKGGFGHNGNGHGQTTSYNSNPNRLNMMRSAMKNSLVRIGTVEGDLVKRALAALIRPSSHQQRRRGDFQPRPSRLSVVSKA